MSNIDFTYLNNYINKIDYNRSRIEFILNIQTKFSFDENTQDLDDNQKVTIDLFQDVYYIEDNEGLKTPIYKDREVFNLLTTYGDVINSILDKDFSKIIGDDLEDLELIAIRIINFYIEIKQFITKDEYITLRESRMQFYAMINKEKKSKYVVYETSNKSYNYILKEWEKAKEKPFKNQLTNNEVTEFEVLTLFKGNLKNEELFDYIVNVYHHNRTETKFKHIRSYLKDKLILDPSQILYSKYVLVKHNIDFEGKDLKTNEPKNGGFMDKLEFIKEKFESTSLKLDVS